MSGFNYTIKHIKGKNNMIADYFSRVPLKCMEENEDEQVSYVNYTTNKSDWSINNELIRKTTKHDASLQTVI